jgi:hypothetical protein
MSLLWNQETPARSCVAQVDGVCRVDYGGSRVGRSRHHQNTSFPLVHRMCNQTHDLVNESAISAGKLADMRTA